MDELTRFLDVILSECVQDIHDLAMMSEVSMLNAHYISTRLPFMNAYSEPSQLRSMISFFDLWKQCLIDKASTHISDKFLLVGVRRRVSISRCKEEGFY